jgi:hypothetical protein
MITPNIFLKLGHIIKECRRLIGHDLNFKINFVKRKTSFDAHSIVGASKSYASSQSFNLIPSCIAIILMNEII